LASIVATGLRRLQFKATGNLLQLYWNGALIVSVTNSRLTTGGVGMRIGQRATLAYFSAN
jgi:hypothetical protein